jgi:hypothetical protein
MFDENTHGDCENGDEMMSCDTDDVVCMQTISKLKKRQFPEDE